MAGGSKRIFEGLNAEWALVCAQAGHAQLVEGWLLDAGVFGPGEVPVGLGEVLRELGRRDRALGREHSDRWLMALLEVAAGRGAEAQLAARVVVQAMVDGAVRTTQRLLRTGREFDEVGQVVIACLYQVVRAYPLSRRRRVAANLLLETLHRATRELAADCERPEVQAVGYLASDAAPLVSVGELEETAWRRVLAEQATAVELVEATADELTGARGELVELLLWGLRAKVVGLERARVIARDVREGGREEAARSGVSAVAWRKRRSRNVAQLREMADRREAVAA